MRTRAKSEERLIGRQTPTKLVKNSKERSYSVLSEEMIDFLEKAGIFLFQWQKKVLDVWLSKSFDGYWAFTTLLLLIARRNGKTRVILAFIFIKIIFFKESVCYTSYHATSMMALFKDARDLISAPNRHGHYLRAFFELPFKKGESYTGPGIQTGAGREALVSKGGGSCVFMTRGGGAGRGTGFDTLILDEAQELDSKDVGIYVPTADGPNPQIVYCGTPSFMDSRSKVFLELRKDIISGEAEDAALIEWSVEKLHKKNDKRAWYRANPSLGLVSVGRGGLSERYIKSKFVLSEEQFNIEILGYTPQQSEKGVIDVNRWNSLVSEEPEPTSTEKIALGIKFEIDGDYYSISVSSKDEGRPLYTSILSDGYTSGPVTDLTAVEGEPSVYIDWKDYFSQVVVPIIKSRKCISVFIDGRVQIAEVQILLAENRLWDSTKVGSFKQGKISFAKPSDVALSSAFFLEKVKSEELTHAGDEMILKTIIDAGKRAIKGSDGAFGFRSISGETRVAILDSMALSVFAVSTRAVRAKKSNDGDIARLNNLKTTRNESFKLGRKTL